MKAEYRRPAALPVENRALADLGRLLFWDPRISASGKTACAACHAAGSRLVGGRSQEPQQFRQARQPQVAAVDRPRSRSKRHAVWLGWPQSDPGSAGEELRRDRRDVGARDRHPVKVEVIEQRIRDIPEYVERFAAALPGAAISIDTIAQAIAAYERTMEPGPAPFDRWIDGDEAAISEAAKRGFVLFNAQERTALLAIPAGVSPTTSSTTSACRRATAAAAWRSRTTRRRNMPSRPRHCARSRCARLTCTTARRRRSPMW